MGTITNNFGLSKPNETDFYDIVVANENADIVDTVLGNTAKLEKAGGTSTAITLTGIALGEGCIKNFIVKANNNAVATTINGKSLYKPNTTTAPKLKANTAVVVWYDAAGDCFFIKASAIEGGTVMASDVLAPKTFENEDGDEIVGTIPSKSAATYTPGTTDQEIGPGQYLSGKQTIKGDTNLVPAKIAKGTTIFNVTGTLDTRQLNFPLSIQDAEPLPLRAGHIWVKSVTLAEQVTAVKILEAVNAGETDGTLMLVVGDLVYHSMSFANTVDVGGVAKQVSVADTISATADWDIMLKTGGVASYRINRPMVYSKIGGVLDIETSYFWDGTSWVMLCQKGTYFYGTANSNYLRLYNKILDSFSFGSQSATTIANFSCSSDGTYTAHSAYVNKRTGDNLSLYFTIASKTIGGVNMQPWYSKMSRNGTLVVVLQGGSTGNYKTVVEAYRDNGTTFELICSSAVLSTNGSTGSYYLITNSDASFVCFSVANSGGYYIPYPYFRNGSVYEATATGLSVSVGWSASGTPAIISYDDNYMFMIEGGGTTLYKFTINYALKTLTKQQSTVTAILSILAVHPGGYLVVRNSSPQVYVAYRTSDMAQFTFNSTASALNISFNLSGDRAIICSGSAYYYSVAIVGNVFTLTQIAVISDATFDNSRPSYLIPW